MSRDPADHVKQLVEEIVAADEDERGASEAAARDGHLPPSGRIERAVRAILAEIGEDPGREGLVRTPERMHRMWRELTCGYQVDPERLINGAIFDVGYSEMVVVRDIEFYSLCEHHMLPFFGKAHIAYLPAGQVIGLSKLPRLLDVFARRLQVQERLTEQVAKAIEEAIAPRGVAVMLEAVHFCMMMRGVEKQESRTTTTAWLGEFAKDLSLKQEFLASLRGASVDRAARGPRERRGGDVVAFPR